MLIAFEGIDASGKETQVGLLADWMVKHGSTNTKTISFPDYDNVTGEHIRHILEGTRKVEGDMTRAVVMQSLMTTNHLEHAAELADAATGGDVLICDRYVVSGQVYGVADGLPSEFLFRIHELLPKAKLQILIDVSVEESFRRRPHRADYYERDEQKLQLVRGMYRELFETNAETDQATWHIIDGEQSVDKVHKQVVKTIAKWRELNATR